MSQVTAHIFDTPHLAVQTAGDVFMEGLADFASKPAGLAADQKMHPVYDHLVRTENQFGGLNS